MNRNAAITSRLVITLNGIRLKKTKLSEDNFQSYTPIKEVEPKAISYIELEIVNQSLQRYPENKRFQFLSTQFGETETLKLMKKYKVGTSKHWDGATVFWQMDYPNRVCTGKIMLYNPTTGKRIKEPYNHVTWVHSVLHKGGYNLKQCFFGEHLLPKEKAVLLHWSKARKRQSLHPTTYPNSYGLHRVERTVILMTTVCPFLQEKVLCYSLIWERPTIGRAKSG